MQDKPSQRTTRLHDLQAIGQSVWYDNIRRDLLHSGKLSQLIAAGVTGLTSNPTIFEKAIAEGSEYDESLRQMLDQEPTAIFESIAIEDIRDAADLFRPVYDETAAQDGYVSIEISPLLADDTTGTVAEALRVWAAVDRPNVMIKVPGTSAGITAIPLIIGQGVNVNVTLIFSLSTYERVMISYLDGLARFASSGGLLSRVASVASFFVSRIDTNVDRMLDARVLTISGSRKRQQLARLRGQAAVANAVLAYSSFRALLASQRFKTLELLGAKPQRLLWASTGTKDPAYPDTYYVSALAGPNTVNTMPPATIEAFLDHGEIESRLEEKARAEEIMHQLLAAGINCDAVSYELLGEGLTGFRTSFDGLLARIRVKRDLLRVSEGNVAHVHR